MFGLRKIELASGLYFLQDSRRCSFSSAWRCNLKVRTILAVSLSSLILCAPMIGQVDADQTVPVATQTLLDGVRNQTSKGVIKSVLMITCSKSRTKGTGFAIADGLIVTTNAHVVAGCGAEDLVGTSPVTNQPVKFSRLEADPTRDLAILCATNRLPYSLRLGGDQNPAVETEVETWGYPLRYEQPAPILSRGYIAGYTVKPGTSVKHLIVNGALNPGNSGGPLIDRGTGKIIGIVVEKWTLWSPGIETAIAGFAHPSLATGGTFTRVNAQGVQESVSDQEVLSETLREFYNVSQVMVGEAISLSELKNFLGEKKRTLRCEVP